MALLERNKLCALYDRYAQKVERVIEVEVGMLDNHQYLVQECTFRSDTLSAPTPLSQKKINTMSTGN